MTRFKFRLEAALRLRSLRVEAEKSRLGELLLQRSRLELALNTLREERVQAAHYVYGMQDPGAPDLRALAVFNLGVESRARQMAEALQRTDAAVNQARQRLLTAERDERAVADLRARQLEEWNTRAQREIETSAQELWLFAHTKRAEDRDGGST